MKAEHRHQLQTNVLADRMGRLLQGMKSAPKSTSTLIWVFVLLALATFVGWRIAVRAAATDHSALWRTLDEATHDPTAGTSELLAIELRNPGTIAGRSARFQLARWELQQGLEYLAANERGVAKVSLEAARKDYTTLMPHCLDVPLLAQEAMMGRATAEESLVGIVETSGATPSILAAGSVSLFLPPPGQGLIFAACAAIPEKRAGSLEKALEYYQELASKYPDSNLGKKAEQRAQELQQNASRTQIERFYAEANKRVTPRPSIPARGK